MVTNNWVCEFSDLIDGKIDKKNSFIYADSKEELEKVIGLSGIRNIVYLGKIRLNKEGLIYGETD